MRRRHVNESRFEFLLGLPKVGATLDNPACWILLLSTSSLHRNNYPERLKLSKRKCFRLRTLSISNHGGAVSGNPNQRIQRDPRVRRVYTSRVQHRFHILHSRARRPNEAVIRVTLAGRQRAAHDHRSVAVDPERGTLRPAESPHILHASGGGPTECAPKATRVRRLAHHHQPIRRNSGRNTLRARGQSQVFQPCAGCPLESMECRAIVIGPLNRRTHRDRRLPGSRQTISLGLILIAGKRPEDSPLPGVPPAIATRDHGSVTGDSGSDRHRQLRHPMRGGPAKDLADIVGYRMLADDDRPITRYRARAKKVAVPFAPQNLKAAGNCPAIGLHASRRIALGSSIEADPSVAHDRRAVTRYGAGVGSRSRPHAWHLPQPLKAGGLGGCLMRVVALRGCDDHKGRTHHRYKKNSRQLMCAVRNAGRYFKNTSERWLRIRSIRANAFIRLP